MGAPKGTIPPAAGMGRIKGSKNKFTGLKKSFLDAFEQTGGTEGLVKWAKAKNNKAQFYQMITKLLPKQVEGDLNMKFNQPPSINVYFEGKPK